MGDKRAKRRGAFLGATYIDRVPEEVRREIDKALVEPPEGRKNVSAIHRQFRLKEDYDVGITTFRMYARRVLRCERMRSIGQIASGLCHGGEAGENLQERGRLLVIQHIVRALEDSELGTSELCSLARAYASQRKLELDVQKASEDASGSEGRFRGIEGDNEDHGGKTDREELARLVREVYGAEVAVKDSGSGESS